MSYRWYARVHSWNEANDWLNGGRSKDLRPLYHAGLFIRRITPGDDDGPIGVGWYPKWARENRDLTTRTLIVYYKQGHALIPGYLMHSPSGRRAAMYYGNLLDMYKRRSKIFIRQDTDPVKKRKRRPCKRCKGMRQWVYRDDYGETVIERCTWCTDGYTGARESYESFEWPVQYIETTRGNGDKVTHPVLQPLVIDPRNGHILKTIDLNVTETTGNDWETGISEGGINDVHNA